eukprot:7909184-Alexandrium_andersonii.AAC.1
MLPAFPTSTPTWRRTATLQRCAPACCCAGSARSWPISGPGGASGGRRARRLTPRPPLISA